MPTIEEAAQALNNGHRDEARRVLMLILADDLFNVDVLLWMAAAAETPEERRKWLQRVVELDPNNSRAQSALRPLQSSDTAPPPSTPSQIAEPKANAQQPIRTEELSQAQQSLASSETEHSRASRRYRAAQTTAIVAASITLVGLFVLYTAPSFSTLGQFMFFGGGLLTALAFIAWSRALSALRKIELQMVQTKVDATKLVAVSIAEWLAASYK